MSRQSKQYWSFYEGGLYVPKSNHLLFQKFISTNKPSMSFGKLRFVKSLLGMSRLAYISMPPPLWLRSSRKGEEKPSIRKLDVVSISSSFVSVNTNISTWFEIRHFKFFCCLFYFIFFAGTPRRELVVVQVPLNLFIFSE